MPSPADRSYLLESLASDIRSLLRRPLPRGSTVTIPFAIEEGLHEAFEFLIPRRGPPDAVRGSGPVWANELGPMWKNRRPPEELAKLATRLESAADQLRSDSDPEEVPGASEPPPAGFIDTDEVCAIFPDIAASPARLVRLLEGEASAVRRHGDRVADLHVNERDFEVFAKELREQR